MNGRLEIRAYEVGHGSSIWVSTPSGINLVIDLGRAEHFSPLVDMYNRGVRTIDALIVTHPHADHFKDVDNLGYFTVSRFFRPSCYTFDEILALNGGGASLAYRQLLEKYWMKTLRHPVEKTLHGDNAGHYTTGDGVSLDLFQPSYVLKADANEVGIVSVLSYYGFKILVFGDNDQTSIGHLLSDSRFQSAIIGTNVLVAPHHGRHSGYSADLMGRITPGCVIVSDAKSVMTSATGLYDQHCGGVSATLGQKSVSGKKCLTTRNNGQIDIVVSPRDGRTYYTVTAARG